MKYMGPYLYYRSIIVLNTLVRNEMSDGEGLPEWSKESMALGANDIPSSITDIMRYNSLVQFSLHSQCSFYPSSYPVSYLKGMFNYLCIYLFYLSIWTFMFILVCKK